MNDIIDLKENLEARDDIFEEEKNDNEIEDIDVPPFDPNQINIITKQDTLINIIERLRYEEINLKPLYQRNEDLWSKKQQSRLIESILIRIPLPAFYFDCPNDKHWEVIDGLQRLSTIKNFILDKNLALVGLEYLEPLKGKKYDDLDRQSMRRINECPITYFQIAPGTPVEVKYSIFRRINTGGLVLNEQEMRNALATDTARCFLQKLAANEYFMQVAPCTDKLKKRMKDHELILRFLAFYHIDVLSRSLTNIAELLNAMMTELDNSTETQREEWEGAFYRAMQRSYELFGDRAFERSAERRVRKNTPLYEVWSVSLSRLSEEAWNTVLSNREKIVSNHMECLQDVNYDKALSTATQKKDHIAIRYNMVNKIIMNYVENN